jgi:predicted PurR-regulated permease PerM
MQTKIIEKYFFFSLLLISFIFAFFIFKPFWMVLVLGISFAIILYPLFNWFKSKNIPNWLSAFITVLIFLILICGPIYGIGTLVLEQSQNVYNSVIKYGNITPLTDSINNSINKILPGNINFDINDKISDFVSLISNNIAKIFSSTLATLFSFILMVLTIFYLLKDGEQWKNSLISLSPLKDEDDRKILRSIVKTINGVIKGYLLIALIQGFLMGIGLYLFGVPNPALWGVVAGIASLIPSIGTAFVSIPAIIYLYAIGNTIPAIGMLVWAVLIVGLIDNLLNPIIVGKSIKVPMLLILFSVLGGISLLGPIGLLIGPLVVGLLYTLISIYKEEFE